MQKKRIFFLVVTLFTLVCSAFSVYGLMNAQSIEPTYDEQAKDELQNSFELFSYYVAEQLDPNYKPISFKDLVDAEEAKRIEDFVQNRIYATYTTMNQDSNFYYEAEYKGKTITSAENFSSKHWTLFENNEDPRIQNALYSEIAWNFGTETAKNIQIHEPKNVKVAFYVHDPVIRNGKYIAHLSNIDALILPQMIFGFFLPLALAVLIVLIFKNKVECETVFFKDFIKWKFEPAFLFSTIGYLLLCMGIFSLSLACMNREFYMTFETIKGIVPISYILYFCLWMLLYWMYWLDLVYIKRMFAEGFLRFVKKDTLLFTFIRWVHKKVKELMEYSLFEGNSATKLVLLFGLFVLVTIFFNIPVLGWFLMMACLIYGLIQGKKYYNRLHKQYDITLEATKKLAEGRFDEVLPYPVGPFQSIYNSLLQVKTGFEKALQEGIQSQNMKTELISNVSHDLKTPLTGIKTYVELVESTDDPKKIKEYAKKIEGYTNRLDRLVVDLFDVSKANSGNIELEKQMIDITSLIEQVNAEHIDALQKKNISIVLKHPDHPVFLDLDPNKTMRIFENLTNNIAKYSHDHTRVFMDIEDQGDLVKITYRNTSSLPLDFNPDEIVERFVRGDKSRHEIGSGLGLAIVKSFTEVQNGTFKIEIDGDLFKAIVTFKKENE